MIRYMSSHYTMLYHGVMIIMAYTWLGLKQCSCIVPDLILPPYPKSPIISILYHSLKNNNKDIHK